jgi:phospholipase/lecithinase/hemolysin
MFKPPIHSARANATVRLSQRRGFGSRLLKVVSLAALLSAALPITAAQAGVPSLSKLFVFGDSLSDSGNSKAISNQATGGQATFPPANLGYVGGRFSNGEVAAEYLWKAFNPGDTSFKASLLPGGTNFAIGGATSGQENFIQVWPITPPDLKPVYADLGNAWQLNRFTTPSLPSFDPQTSLFMVWFYPNDAFWNGATSGQSVGSFDGSTQPAGLKETAVYNIKGTIEKLASYGAKNFLVPNTPDLGLVPEFINDPVQSAYFSGISSQFNSLLATELNGLALSRPDLDIVAFQTDDLFAEVRANPGAFGFSDISNRCQTTPGCRNGSATEQSSFLFWDGTHPTTATHRLIGQRFYQSVYDVPGPLPAAGVAAAYSWSRRLRQRLRQNRQGQEVQQTTAGRD